jgi:hypothetical protein
MAIPPVLMGQALAIAAQPALSLSRAPAVVNYGSYVVIELDPALQKEVADFIIRQLESEPGAVRVAGLGGVLARVLARKYSGWIGGALAGSFGLGWLSTKAKGKKR